MYINILSQFSLTLKSLYMDIPDSPDFAQFLTNFSQLTDLGVNARDGFKMIITNDTFKPLRNLPIRTLMLHSNKLSGIEAMAFSWFPQLESLDLSNSSGVLDINGLGKAWYGMKNNTKLKSLNLDHFGLKSNPVVLNRSFFEYFNLVDLRYLRLDHCKIEGAVSWKYFKSSQHLRNLSLSFNHLNYTARYQNYHEISNIRNT